MDECLLTEAELKCIQDEEDKFIETCVNEGLVLESSAHNNQCTLQILRQNLVRDITKRKSIDKSFKLEKLNCQPFLEDVLEFGVKKKEKISKDEKVINPIRINPYLSVYIYIILSYIFPPNVKI